MAIQYKSNQFLTRSFQFFPFKHFSTKNNLSLHSFHQIFSFQKISTFSSGPHSNFKCSTFFKLDFLSNQPIFCVSRCAQISVNQQFSLVFKRDFGKTHRENEKHGKGNSKTAKTEKLKSSEKSKRSKKNVESVEEDGVESAEMVDLVKERNDDVNVEGEKQTKSPSKIQQSLEPSDDEMEKGHLVSLKGLDSRFEEALQYFRERAATLRTGRTDPTMLDDIKVLAYDVVSPLNSIAQISFVSAKLLQVTVFDSHLVKAVEKALRESHLSLNPSVNNNVLDVPIPKTTKESRENTAKIAKAFLETGKKKLMHVRRDAQKILKAKEKDSGVSKDDIYRVHQEIDAELAKFTKKLDELFEAKEKEILTE